MWAGAFSPDGKTVATGSEDGVVRLWSTADGSLLRRRLEHRGNIRDMTFSCDGKYLLTGSFDGMARLWQVETGTLKTALLHRRAVEAVAISPDDKTLLTGVQGQMRLWDAATGKPLGAAVRDDSGNRHTGVAFSPDGKTYMATDWPVGGKVPQPLKGDVERILLWVQVLTGMELDESGAAGFLDSDTWQKRKQRLEKLGGAPQP
jgi:WD40 repeat protein